MRAGVLTVDIAANLARLTSDMAQAKTIVDGASRDIKRSLSAVQSALGTLGVGVTAGGFAFMIKGALDAEAGLLRLAQRTGSTVEAMSALSPVAKRSETDLDSVAVAMARLAKNMAESGDGTTKAAKVFDTLHVAVKDAETGALRPAQDVMRELGSKLASMRDQTLAAAFATEVLGKNGAAMLPFLYELARAGELHASVTKRQAEEAKAFADNLAQMDKQTQAAKRSLANDMLPTLIRLTDEFIAAREASSGFWNSVPKFFSISGAEGANPEAALGAEVAKLERMKKLRDEFASPPTTGVFGAFSTFKAMWSSDDIAALDKQIAYAQSRVQILDKLVTRLHSNLGRDANSPYFEFAGGGIPIEPANPLGQNDALVKRYTSTLQSLEKQYFDLQHAGSASFIMYETERGTLVKLDDERKTTLVTMGQEIDAWRRRLEIGEAVHSALEAQKALESANQKAIAGQLTAYAQERDDLAFEIALVGRSTLEQEKMNAVRKVDLDLRRTILALPPIDEGNVDALANRQAAIDRLRADAEDQKRVILDSVDVRQRAERSWIAGVKSGMNDYVDATTNAAAMSKQLFVDAFQGMEDALVKFVKTGKLNFNDLVGTIETDLARIAIRQYITGPLAQMIGPAFASAGSAAGSMLGSGLGSLGFTSAAGWLGASSGPVQLAGPGAAAGGTYGAAGAGGMSSGAAMAGGIFTALALGDYMSARNGRDWTRTIWGGAPPMAARINEKLGVPQIFTDPLYMFSSGAGDAMRSAQFMGGFGQAGAIVNDQWFSGGEMNPSLNAFSAAQAAAEQNLIANMHLRPDQVAAVNAALGPLGGKTYQFGMEHTDVTQSGAFAQIQSDRLTAISQVLGRSIKDLTDIMSVSAEQWQAQIDSLQSAYDTGAAQLGQLARTLPETLGITSLEQYQQSLSVSDAAGSPMDRLAAARSIYDSTLGRARGGDLSAVSQFPGVAQQLIGLGQQVYASGPDFQDLFVSVNKALQDVLDAQRSTQADILKDVPAILLQTNSDQLAAIRQQTKELSSGLKDIQFSLDRMRNAQVG